VQLTGDIKMTVDIAPWDILQGAVALLRETYQLSNVDGIDAKGRMYETVEHHTSHSWDVDEDRGEPTAEQREALQAIRVLNNAAQVHRTRSKQS
jgi:hypothetical protein